ncbi:MAG: phosphoglycerate mutase family protein [bacterium]
MNKRLPLLIILLLPVAICFLAWYCWYSPVATVFLVRHAERLNDSDTTSISEKGIERANDLAHALSSAGIQRIYVSEKSRTTQTAHSAALQLGISPTVIPGKEISRYMDSVKAHRGDNILIVGHSDTVPLIMGKLGVSPLPTIGAKEFDDLFVVTVFRFRTTMIQLKYGKSSGQL